MATQNYDPNARFDHGPNAAGTGRVSNQPTLQAESSPGLAADGALEGAELRVGFSAAGVPRNNVGPNVAGSPRSINNT